MIEPKPYVPRELRYRKLVEGMLVESMAHGARARVVKIKQGRKSVWALQVNPRAKAVPINDFTLDNWRVV